MKCGYPECKTEIDKRHAATEHRYYYQNKYGYVCPLHDRLIGSNNLVAEGWSREAAELWATKPWAAEKLHDDEMEKRVKKVFRGKGKNGEANWDRITIDKGRK